MLYPLSYRPKVDRAGFEPATSRVRAITEALGLVLLSLMNANAAATIGSPFQGEPNVRGAPGALSLCPPERDRVLDESGTGGRNRTRVGAVLEAAAKPLSYTRVLVAAAGDDPAAKPLWGVTVHQRTAATKLTICR